MTFDLSAEPSVTEMVAHCSVCGARWQVMSPNYDDARGCSFCDSPKEAITLEHEENFDPS